MITKVNINNTAQARLTEHGLRILREYEDAVYIPLQYRNSVTDGNLWKGQVWHLMRVFGPAIVMGDLLFVDNIIEVSERQWQS